MDDYKKLEDYLLSEQENEIEMTYEEIKEIINGEINFKDFNQKMRKIVIHKIFPKQKKVIFFRCLDTKVLYENRNLIHTTPLGLIRIQNNLNISINPIDYFLSHFTSLSQVYKNHKNWYVIINDAVFTINASNYCIITAHQKKRYYEI